MKKPKKPKKPNPRIGKCPDGEPDCDGLQGRHLRICGSCHVEKNKGTRPG